MNPARAKLFLTLLSLGSGALLVAGVLLHIHLGLAMACLAVMMGSLLAKLCLGLSPSHRPAFLRSLGLMLLAGLSATLTYDLSRFLIVSLTKSGLNPFGAFPHFGSLLIGETQSRSARVFVGTLYHFWNGMFFGLAYLLMAASRKFYWGIVFAFALEALMLAIYPQWLKLADVLGEFTLMSLSGHFFYGLVLGCWGQRLPRWRISARAG